MQASRSSAVAWRLKQPMMRLSTAAVAAGATVAAVAATAAKTAVACEAEVPYTGKNICSAILCRVVCLRALSAQVRRPFAFRSYLCVPTRFASSTAGEAGTRYERTFIAVKPDGVQRNAVGDIIGRFEKKGYKLVGLKMLTPSKAQAEGHYSDLAGKKFFPGLVNFFSSGPIVAMVWEGADVILGGRRTLGATNPRDSAPGSIRGDLCVDISANSIHGSDGPESAAKEIAFWFGEEEVQQYEKAMDKWIYVD